MKPLLQLLNLEPVGVEGHHVRRSVLLVVAIEVFLEPFQDFVRVVVVQDALVEVGAMAPFVRLHEMGVQWDLP